MGRVIPEFPRIEELDAGPEWERNFMDPRRDPHERLPGKKARKRMAEKREATRRASDGGAKAQGPKPAEGRAGASPTPADDRQAVAAQEVKGQEEGTWQGPQKGRHKRRRGPSWRVGQRVRSRQQANVDSCAARQTSPW